MTSVPFMTNEAHGGLTMVRGTFGVDDEDVVFEVQTSLLGLFKRAPHTYRFDLTDLEEVHHRRGLLRDTLCIRTQPMDRATQVPGSKDGTLTLRVKRQHRRDLDHVLQRLQMWLT